MKFLLLLSASCLFTFYESAEINSDNVPSFSDFPPKIDSQKSLSAWIHSFSIFRSIEMDLILKDKPEDAIAILDGERKFLTSFLKGLDKNNFSFPIIDKMLIDDDNLEYFFETLAMRQSAFRHVTESSITKVEIVAEDKGGSVKFNGGEKAYRQGDEFRTFFSVSRILDSGIWVRVRFDLQDFFFFIPKGNSTK